jgi:hypothetical protein
MKPINKVLLFSVLLAVVALGIYVMKKTYTPPQTIVEPPTTEPVSTNKTFTGTGFSFVYPKDATIDNDLTYPWQFNTAVPGTLLARIVIPRSVQPSTNLSDSLFIVGTSIDTQALKECLLATNGEIAKGDTTINGITYKRFELGDAGAGNLYDTTSYRTIHNGQCYAVSYTIHSTNIGNYDPSQGITAFDRVSITHTLEAIAQSFRFI